MFSENLKQAMHTREITQTQLSNTTGIAKSGISQYLSGKVTPKENIIRKLADALEVTVEFLTGKTEPQTTPNFPKIEPFKNVSVADAAKMLGKSKEFVRVALQRGIAPFGMAVKISGNKYTYHISPRKLEQYIKGEI